MRAEASKDERPSAAELVAVRNRGVMCPMRLLRSAILLILLFSSALIVVESVAQSDYPFRKEGRRIQALNHDSNGDP